MSGQTKSTVLLGHHLKALKLPVFLREHEKVAERCAKEKLDYDRYLLQLSELELIERERKGAERRIRDAEFPVLKTLESFKFAAIPSLNKKLVMELARCEYIGKKENVLAIGNSGTGKTHIAIALGLAACRECYKVRFFTAAGLVTALTEARVSGHENATGCGHQNATPPGSFSNATSSSVSCQDFWRFSALSVLKVVGRLTGPLNGPS